MYFGIYNLATGIFRQIVSGGDVMWAESNLVQGESLWQSETPIDDASCCVDVATWELKPLVEALTGERLKASIVQAVQLRLDLFAQSRGYDSILSACTYANSKIPQFRKEGQYCVNARDDTWSKLYQMLAQVENGTRPIPSGYAAIESDLPPLVWPN